MCECCVGNKNEAQVSETKRDAEQLRRELEERKQEPERPLAESELATA